MFALSYRIPALLLVVCMAAAPAMAKDRNKERGSKHDSEGGFGFLRELNLSEDQRTKIKEAREASKADLEAKREKFHAAMEAFHEGLKNDQNEASLRSLFDTMQTARQEMGKARFEMMLKIRSNLTAEQKKKFGELKSKMKERFHGRRHGKGQSDDFDGEDRI